MTKRELLTHARDKISQGWCQGEMARDRNGDAVLPSSSEARQWCLVGAVLSVPPTSMREYIVQNQVLIVLAELTRMSWWKVGRWNEKIYRTQEEVVALLDRAIIEVAERNRIRRCRSEK
jgi:hypothetical protein